MDVETKAEVIKEYALRGGDTGSSDVQVAVLTHRIKELTEHMKANKKDNHTRRGLQLLVQRRKKHLKYLSRTQHDRYRELIQKLGLRR
jgi:small subunit ribosomal protein S15